MNTGDFYREMVLENIRCFIRAEQINKELERRRIVQDVCVHYTREGKNSLVLLDYNNLFPRGVCMMCNKFIYPGDWAYKRVMQIYAEAEHERTLINQMLRFMGMP